MSVRQCELEDLPALEWFGLFTDHREIIVQTFGRQERAEALMLLADLNGFPVGQAWLDFAKYPPPVVLVWAVRVFPFLRGLGIGTRLLLAAERAALEHGRGVLEIGVEKGNTRALRLYERLGYERAGELVEHYDYASPSGWSIQATGDLWRLQKHL